MKKTCLHSPSRWIRAIYLPVSGVFRRRLARGFSWLLCGLILSGCARVSDPLPPLILIPKHSDALELKQIGSQIHLMFPLPTLNTDGSPSETPHEIRIYRVTEDRQNSQKEKNAGVFLAQAKRIATLRETDFNQYTTRQGRILYVDELDFAGHPRVFQSSFGYAVEFVTKKGQSDGPSNIARVAPIPIPGALTGIRLIPKPESIRLEWDAPKVNLDGTRPPRIIGYNVYRSFESPPQFAHPLNASPIQTTQYEDHDFAFGKGVSYAVTVVGRRGAPDTESPLSAPLKVIPRDTFPPKTPERLQTLIVLDAIHIRWNANTEADLAGYFIYRSEVENELGIRLQEKPLRGTLFIDRSADLQKTYYYRVTAVDALSNESQPTPPSSPSPPQDPEGVPVHAF